MDEFMSLDEQTTQGKEESVEYGLKEKVSSQRLEGEDDVIADEDDTAVEGGALPQNGSLSFHDLSYEVAQRKHFRKLPNKTILDAVRLATHTATNCCIIDI